MLEDRRKIELTKLTFLSVQIFRPVTKLVIFISGLCDRSSGPQILQLCVRVFEI